MYTQTKVNGLSIVTRGPLKEALFGVPAGNYITYVRPCFGGNSYGDPLDTYPVQSNKYAREAWAAHFTTVQEVEENNGRGVNIRFLANEDPAPQETPAEVKAQPSPKPGPKPVKCVSEDEIQETIFEICVRNSARLLDKTGTLERLFVSFHEAGISYTTIFNALRDFIYNPTK